MIVATLDNIDHLPFRMIKKNTALQQEEVKFRPKKMEKQLGNFIVCH